MGKVFKTGHVDEWMDCGNKAVTVKRTPECSVFYRKKRQQQAVNVRIDNSNYSTLLHWRRCVFNQFPL
jgi:glucose-1-phosphate thymidylyltransferase